MQCLHEQHKLCHGQYVAHGHGLIRPVPVRDVYYMKLTILEFFFVVTGQQISIMYHF
jgi:hypothetical protein